MGRSIGTRDEIESPQTGISSKSDSGRARSAQRSNSRLHVTPQMAIHAYPGQGLSPSQLIFALNEELKRVAYCSS